MAQIIVRNLPKEVVDRLKERARSEGRSLEAEVRNILQKETGSDMTKFAREIIKFRERWKGRKFSDSAALIREDREQR
jgi:antitoxin FitA